MAKQFIVRQSKKLAINLAVDATIVFLASRTFIGVGKTLAWRRRMLAK